MGLLAKIFTWWDGATIGTMLFTSRKGVAMGEDALGNAYYQSHDGTKRWVIYNGANDASRVAPEWHSWLHGTIDDVPARAMPVAKHWERPSIGNLTGTPSAYRPAGTLETAGQDGASRARASGDYTPWTPDQA